MQELDACQIRNVTRENKISEKIYTLHVKMNIDVLGFLETILWKTLQLPACPDERSDIGDCLIYMSIFMAITNN